jgi:Spy/CpxP family protein refolding chaperone
MRKHWLLALLLVALLYAVTPAVTQDNGGNEQQSSPAGAHPPGRGHMDPARRTEMLTRQLKLTPDQQSKVLDILKSAQSQAESLRSDSSAAPQDRHAKMMEVHKTADDQIRALLNPDQQNKWDTMQTRRQGRMQRRGQGQPPDSSEQH